MTAPGERSIGRRLFWVLAPGLVALVLGTLGRLPPVVASHFDMAGTPNGWSSRPIYALLLITIGTVLPLGMIALVHALSRRGPQLLNIPSREFWTRPEHQGEAVRRVRAYMWWLGSIMAGIAGTVHLLILRAHAYNPPHLSATGIWLVLGGAVLIVGLWTAGWYRLLRLSPLILLWLATGCGGGWQREELGPEGRLRPRQQVQLWLGQETQVLHAVELAADSVSGVPFHLPPECDSCRVVMARSVVDSMRLGNKERGALQSVGLGYVALGVAAVVLYLSVDAD